MLSHLASLARFGGKGVGLSRADGSRDAVSHMKLSVRFRGASRARSLHMSRKLMSPDGFKGNSAEYISMVIPSLDTSITEQYWPSSGDSVAQTDSSSSSTSSQYIDSSYPHPPSTGSSTEERYNEESKNSRLSSSHRSNRDFRHESGYERGHGYRDTRNTPQRERKPYQERENDGTRRWQAVRLQSGPTPSHPPRPTVNAHLRDRIPVVEPTRPPTRPPTSHLTEKSIYLRQAITQASTAEEFLRECELYQQSPNFDAFIFEVSRLMYQEKFDSELSVRSGYVHGLLQLLSSEMCQQISSRRSDPFFQPTFSGEKIDLAFSLIPSAIFSKTENLLDIVVEFLEVNGKFDPPVLPSTWRRLWTSVAHLVSRHGFMKPDYQHLCDISVAIYNYIYIHQSEMSGHSRRSSNEGSLKTTFLNRPAPLSKFDGIPRSEKSLMNLELPEMVLETSDAPLLRGPQAVSAMLAILSQVSGHVRLKRVLVDLYGSMVMVKNAYPTRRIFPLAALLFSWGEVKAARAGFLTLQANHPSEMDPKSSQYELSSLEFLMVTNNAPALLEFAELLTTVPGHIPSPLALTHIVWAIQQTGEYERILKWWRSATQTWRTIPTMTQKGNASLRLLIRCPIDATMTLLDMASDHLSAEALTEITQDFTDIFGIRPAGSRSRIVSKYAKEGNVEEAIRLLNSTYSSSPKRSSNDRPDRPDATASPFIMSANIVLSMIQNAQFDAQIAPLLNAIVSNSTGPFSPGMLVNHICSMHEEVTSHEEALKWVPFLRWVASLPMIDSSAPVLSAALVHPFANDTRTMLEDSLAKYPDHDKTMSDLVTIRAKSIHRLVNLAGLAGVSDIVSSLIARVNMQYRAENEGETMPFSAVWLRPLVQAHAFEGSADTVYKLLISLKQSMLPSEREKIWKVAFKAYCKAQNTDHAVNLIINIRNQTIDPQIPTWSGGYTMSIQLMLAQSRFAEALQMYSLMIADGFELRDLSIVHNLIQQLRSRTPPQKTAPSSSYGENIAETDAISDMAIDSEILDASSPSIASQSPPTDSPLEETPTNDHSEDTTPFTTGNSNYDALLNRLLLLEPTLDASKPASRNVPGQNSKRRYAKERRMAEQMFLSKLEYAMKPARSSSSSGSFSSSRGSL